MFELHTFRHNAEQCNGFFKAIGHISMEKGKHFRLSVEQWAFIPL